MLTENGIITSRFIPCRDKDSNLFKSESKFKKELKSESKALGFSLAKPFANFFKKSALLFKWSSAHLDIVDQTRKFIIPP